MRRPLLSGCLLLALASIASSQSEAPVDETLLPSMIIPPTAPAARPEAAAKPDAAKKPVTAADQLSQCLRDWDAATHMTRQEWSRTCRRVVSNRVKFMNEQQGK
jgi:hypothetical protein